MPAVKVPGVAAKQDPLFDENQIVADLVKKYGENVFMRHIKSDGFNDPGYDIERGRYEGFTMIDTDSVGDGIAVDGFN